MRDLGGEIDVREVDFHEEVPLKAHYGGRKRNFIPKKP